MFLFARKEFEVTVHWVLCIIAFAADFGIDLEQVFNRFTLSCIVFNIVNFCIIVRDKYNLLKTVFQVFWYGVFIFLYKKIQRKTNINSAATSTQETLSSHSSVD